MSDQQLIEDYNEWVAYRKLNDTTPETFLKERAKAVAFDRLLKALEYIEEYVDHETMSTDILSIRSILEGND